MPPTDAELRDTYLRIETIRQTEIRVGELYRAGEIPGFVHTSIGQEACAVGMLWHARPSDVITSTHRGHGHVLAKGLSPRRMMAELMGKETGANRGRGGSMHVADPRLGIFGANGIVGAGLPIAVGAAFAIRQRKSDDVVIAFFGDGAIATGAFHEAVNLAALWRLPIVFACENNGFSEFSQTSDQHPVPITARAAGYGIDATSIAGNNVFAVAEQAQRILSDVRGGAGPHLVELVTMRVHGHYEGDPQRYREPDQMADEIADHDPITVARKHLRHAGIDDAALESIAGQATETVRDAEEFGRTSPPPVPDDLVYAPRDGGGFTDGERGRIAPSGKPLSSSRMLRAALSDALADDDRVVLAGIDVAGGNVFGITRGLADEFPGRIYDTPIAETAIMGLGVGAAIAGLRPVVELMYLDFVGVCLDQLMNQAAKMRLMTGGAVTVPMVVRTQCGSGKSSGSQHSQSLEAMLAHIPGLTVVMPSNAADAYGLLRACIEDDNPVIFIENRLLYEKKMPFPGNDFRVQLGKAAVVRPGTDVTIVSWSRMVGESLVAAQELAAEGIEAEVIDLRTIAPLDRDTVLRSFAKTNRMVIAQEAVSDFGVGAEIAATIVDQGFWSLDAPVLRVGAGYSPAPYAPSLEHHWRPQVSDITGAVRTVMTQ